MKHGLWVGSNIEERHDNYINEMKSKLSQGPATMLPDMERS